MHFKKGDSISTSNGRTYKIVDLLGEGGQGEVYLISDGRDKYALKIYKTQMSTDFIFNLKHNIEKGRPTKDFLWPKEIYQDDNGTSGYIMDLRPKEYVSFISYLNGKSRFDNQALLIKWCVSLCSDFKALHERGFSYQDLNDGSFFLNPTTGDLLICDNDNVTADKKNLGVLGKMRYMAPEIVTGKCMPDIHSDRFSLAIILFMALCLGNPFEGERLKNYQFVDENAEYEMYGSNPVFVYHKIDKSNRPIRGYHSSVLKRWPYLPIYIKEGFHRTFVDGILERENERTTELEWLRLLTKYRDELITCPQCHYQYIYGFEEKKINDICPACHRNTGEVCVLEIGKSQITLDEGKEIYACHLDKYSSDYQSIKGRVIRSKKNPGLLGIRLLLDKDVIVKDQTDTTKEIKRNGVIPLIHNLKIEFDDDTKGEIVCLK